MDKESKSLCRTLFGGLQVISVLLQPQSKLAEIVQIGNVWTPSSLDRADYILVCWSKGTFGEAKTL